MWVLAATMGMRRSELLGVRRDSGDLDAGTLVIDETLISVGGRAEESDDKTAAGLRTVSLDAFTIGALRRQLAMLDTERQAFGPAYAAGGWLFVWENGQRPHPDTVTGIFNRLVDQAGARRIQLHDATHLLDALARLRHRPQDPQRSSRPLQPERHIPGLHPCHQWFRRHRIGGRVMTGSYYRFYYEYMKMPLRRSL